MGNLSLEGISLTVENNSRLTSYLFNNTYLDRCLLLIPFRSLEISVLQNGGQHFCLLIKGIRILRQSEYLLLLIPELQSDPGRF